MKETTLYSPFPYDSNLNPPVNHTSSKRHQTMERFHFRDLIKDYEVWMKVVSKQKTKLQA